MGVLESIIVIISLGLLVALVLIVLQGFFYLLISAIGLESILISQKTKNKVREQLNQIDYFKKLSDEGKKIFIDRVVIFMTYKNFRGGDKFEITDETKTLISATAVQLTFGLDNYKLNTLTTIIVFPSTFTLPKTKYIYKGATLRSVMVLSWKDFKLGIDDPSDKINLGIHEMTHALKLDTFLGEEYDNHFRYKIKHWENYLVDNFEVLRKESDTFLREYHNANHNEFFAVAVEAFFERPQDFQKHLPEIFDKLAYLLNQDPTNLYDDYRLRTVGNSDNNAIKNIASALVKKD